MAWRDEDCEWQMKQTRHDLLGIRKKFEDMRFDPSANEYDRPHRQEGGSYRNRYRSYEDYYSNSWGCGSDGRWRAGSQRWYPSRGQGEATHWRSSSQGSWRTQPSHDPYGNSTPIKPFDLVNYLCQFQTFSSTLPSILQEMDVEPALVRQVALRYSDVFLLNGGAVELRPRVSLCTAHRSSQGCRNWSCQEFHICHKYVLSVCFNGFGCSLGHKWRTDHNIFIMKKFFLQYIEVPLLRKLVQVVLKPEMAKKRLDVCRAYDEGGCNLDDCDDLHVCLSFVVGLAKCSRQNCERNHQLKNPECTRQLIAHGFSANDAPRDIVLALLSANPGIVHSQDEGSVASRKDSIGNHLPQKTPRKDTKMIGGVRNEKDGEREERDVTKDMKLTAPETKVCRHWQFQRRFKWE